MSNPDEDKDEAMIYQQKRHSQLTRHRTTHARGKLYELIAQFRRDAARTEDPKARQIFEFAAEVVAGLARGFRDYEDDLIQESREQQQTEDGGQRQMPPGSDQ